MKVKIVYDPFECEYIAFIESLASFSGYGKTEKEAIIDFLHQCENNPNFNKPIIKSLLNNIQ